MVSREPIDQQPITKEITVKTKPNKKLQEMEQNFKWWLAQTDDELCGQLLSTTSYLKKVNEPRVRQASIFTRLFSGKPLYNYLANVSTLDNSQQLPIGRPTANVVYSCTDTLVSRVTQDRPRPVFLTDNSHYKERNLSNKLNSFMMGELFRTKSYDLGALALRDACILGDGFLKVFPMNNKVQVERVLSTELLTDYNDAYKGNPRNLIQMKSVDRGVLLSLMPEKADIILAAQQGTIDKSPLSTETVSDQFIVSEGWHLESSEGAGDGRHVIVCSAGVILDESWTKPTFPFVKMPYNPNIVGYFSQGLAEILMPTQMEIYKMLIIASQSIELMGVPRILIDEMSKILETSFNNNIGTIIKYNRTPPIFNNAQSNNPEIYQWIQWLISNAFQMSGISALSAASQKPAGLNSGEAIRSYDDIQTDRFAALAKRYQNIYPDLSYLMIDCAADIQKLTGKYTTVYPDKDGTREIDLPEAETVLQDTYIIQCSEESALSKDPAGRKSQISEMLAAGEIDKTEFRRLMAEPDLKQADSLANALENRILFCLDAIVEKGKSGFKRPDIYMLDPTDIASTRAVQYINLYQTTDMEESKLQLLRDWWTQVQTLKQQANPPQPQPAPVPGAAPEPGALQVAPPNPSIAPTSGVQV
jgi:hypothetical protein